MRGSVERVCEGCSKPFFIYRAWLRDGNGGKYCSRACADEHRKRVAPTILTGKCLSCGTVFQRNKHRAGKMEYCSTACRAKKAMPKGESHPNWKGGVSERTYLSRAAIRRKVREIGACERCGRTENLHGHHRHSYAEHPELRAAEENIEVLCADCHAEQHPSLSGMLKPIKQRKGRMVDCEECGTRFYAPPYKLATARWCSRACQANGLPKLNRGKKRNVQKLDCGSNVEA